MSILVPGKRSFPSAGLSASYGKDLTDVVAIMLAYNEELIVEATLRHLIDQGIGVYFLDHGSTDATMDIAVSMLGRGVIAAERYHPGDQPDCYDLRSILREKERLAVALARRGARWIINHDADEIRESPWPGITLRDGLRRVAREGYNAVDFAVVNFVPTDDRFEKGQSPQRHFTHYLPKRPGSQVKAWIQGKRPVDLTTHAGHYVQFDTQTIYPIRFVLKHYPILSSAHGRRKIFQERRPRYSKAGIARGWHIHYNHIRDESHAFVYAPDDPRLRIYDEHAFKLELQNCRASLSPGRLQKMLWRLKRIF